MLLLYLLPIFRKQFKLADWNPCPWFFMLSNSSSDLYRPRLGGSASCDQDNISISEGVELDKSSVHSGSQPIHAGADALAELGGAGGEATSGTWTNRGSESDAASLSEVNVKFFEHCSPPELEH